MNTVFPNIIEVVFTEEDTKKAKDYCDSDNCLLATALKRMGYNRISVAGLGEVDIYEYDGDESKIKHNYSPKENWFNGNIQSFSYGAGYTYKKSVIGLKLTLMKQ